MRRVGRTLLALAVAAAVAIGGLTHDVRDAHASDPSGVYALIDSVVLEPGDGPPTRVRINGLFCQGLPRVHRILSFGR